MLFYRCASGSIIDYTGRTDSAMSLGWAGRKLYGDNCISFGLIYVGF